MTATVERPPTVSRARWYDPRTPWYARKKASDAWHRANRPEDVTQQRTAQPEQQRPDNECPTCGLTFKSRQGVATHHPVAHGRRLDTCSAGHDLTQPRARKVNGGCRECQQERDRERWAAS